MNLRYLKLNPRHQSLILRELLILGWSQEELRRRTGIDRAILKRFYRLESVSLTIGARIALASAAGRAERKLMKVYWPKGELQVKLTEMFDKISDRFEPISPEGIVMVRQNWSKCTCGAFESRENLPHSKNCPDHVELTPPGLGYAAVNQRLTTEVFKQQMSLAIQDVLGKLRARGLIKPPDFKIGVTQDPNDPNCFHFSYEIPHQGIEFNLEVPDEG